MIYGYARVSTQAQDLESQLQAEGAQEIFEEKFTGTQTDRWKKSRQMTCMPCIPFAGRLKFHLKRGSPFLKLMPAKR